MSANILKGVRGYIVSADNMPEELMYENRTEEVWLRAEDIKEAIKKARDIEDEPAIQPYQLLDRIEEYFGECIKGEKNEN